MIDYVLFFGYKLYVLKGIGVLYICKGSVYILFIVGGG